jgi:uncharacterized protein YegP (UPF0339 family)
MNDPRFVVFPERTPTITAAVPGMPTTRVTGRFVWHLQAADGKIVATGGEAFTRREDARRSIETVGDILDATAAVPIVDLDADGKAIE